METKRNPEAILESFKKWLNKGRRGGLLKPARHEHFPSPDSKKKITPDYYNATLYYVFFNELRRTDPSFKDIEDESFAHFSEEYDEMVKIAFPPNVYYEWVGIDRKMLRIFIELLYEKEMVAKWEQPESMEYDYFRKTIWDLFNAELVRRGKIQSLKKGNEFYRKCYK